MAVSTPRHSLAFQDVTLKQTFPAMWQAGLSAVARLQVACPPDKTTEIEIETSHAAADAICCKFFSLPITDWIAAQVFQKFNIYQLSQPLLNASAFLKLPSWMSSFFLRDTRRAARSIRQLITELTDSWQQQITAGTAPNDLATKIMTLRDPETDDQFSVSELVDQVVIFLAEHETSVSALSGALYLLALHPEWQDRVATEAAMLTTANYAVVRQLKFSRDVFRKTLRLYPPVPIRVRQSTCPETFATGLYQRAPDGDQPLALASSYQALG